MKEAFVRYDDGRPFFRDLKVMEIVEDMEILKNIDKEIIKEKEMLPPIIPASSLKKNKIKRKPPLVLWNIDKNSSYFVK